MFKYHAKFNKRVNDVQFWTHDNHAVELFDHNIFKTRLEYIHNNPVKAGWVDAPEHYLYSSARNYADEDALIEIDLAFWGSDETQFPQCTGMRVRAKHAWRDDIKS